ncbi:hypothetical protein KM043_007990 [Ampulex compressa]|nr:hypothetical protein KM043_007990 [Ampulex compressa]
MQNNRQWSETSNYVQLQWGIIVLIIAYLCFGSQWILLLTRSFTPITALNNETSMYLTPEELVKKAGCIYEKHIVQTEDGYLLQVDRIRRGCNAPIVLFLHGIFASSTSFIILGRNNSLAFTLFDEGYDVWLGNFRGNMFSREHVTLDPSEEEFWNFGWHESGIYDLPAMLSYITSFCKKEVDALINHSMGGTVFFVMASQRPEALRSSSEY